MANRVSDEKANLIASHYCTNGYNKVQALLSAGYKHSYAIKNGLYLWDNVKVKQAIDRIMASSKAKTTETVDSIRQKHLELYELAKTDGDLSTANQCLAYAGKTIAAYSDNINTMQLEQPAELSEAELDRLRQMAEIVTKPKVKLMDVG